jgi:hypothetical protein
MVLWFLIRFLGEGALFLFFYYLLMNYGYPIFTNVRLEPGEDGRRFWQRRFALYIVNETILVQEQWFGEGEETREWFVNMITELPLRGRTEYLRRRGQSDTETQ